MILQRIVGQYGYWIARNVQGSMQNMAGRLKRFSKGDLPNLTGAHSAKDRNILAFQPWVRTDEQRHEHTCLCTTRVTRGFQ